MKPNIGISEEARGATAEGLGRLLADTYTLYLKTHRYHWNVEGPMFQALHQMFMVQYTELWNAVDLIAERIRALGEYAPGTYKAFVELSSIYDDEGDTGGLGVATNKVDLPSANINFGKVRGYDTEGTLYIREKR